MINVSSFNYRQSFNIDQLIKLIYLALEKNIDNTVTDFIDSILPVNLRGKSGETTAEILKKINQTQ